MQMIVTVPFASKVEALGYSSLRQQRDEAMRAFALAAGEIGQRAEIPGGATAVIVDGGLQFTWDVPDAEPPKEE